MAGIQFTNMWMTLRPITVMTLISCVILLVEQRKRSQRSRPYSKRKGNSFSANDFYRGFGRSYGTQGFPRPMHFQGMQFDSRFYASSTQFPQYRSCSYYKQSSHFVRDCPFIKVQPIPTLYSFTGGGQSARQ